MTKDQKQVLRNLAIFVGFKVILYIGIAYASKRYRRLMLEQS